VVIQSEGISFRKAVELFNLTDYTVGLTAVAETIVAARRAK